MDVSKIRADFPTVRKGSSVYLDNACQSLKPDQVIRKMVEYYEEYPSCGGRSVHSMATRVSTEVDETREKMARFFGSDDPRCFVFTKNATEGLNTVALGLDLGSGDVVLTSDTEHNSNHVQWFRVQERGIKRRFFRTSERGEFDIEAYKEAVTRDVKAVSVTQTSNVTGVTYPIKEMAEIAHDAGAVISVDGAQAAPHIHVDMIDLDVDFYSASMHKMLAPTGVGMLYGKEEALKSLRPLMYGGGTVGLTTYDSVKTSPAPEKFEAGLLNYSGIIGTSAALDYLSGIGMKEVEAYEISLQRIIQEAIEEMPEVSVVGPEDPASRGGIFSFNVKGLSSHDVAVMMDSIGGVMVRSGMHCAHPFFESRNLEGSVRASVYIYNDRGDIERFLLTLRKIIKAFSK